MLKSMNILRKMSVFGAVLLIVLTSCTGEAPVVNDFTTVVPSPSEDLGTLLPQIQVVYPGTLQTLDVPQSYPADVVPKAADIIVTFSHVMENDANEMAYIFNLMDGLVPVYINITPAASAKTFVITPASGSFNPDSEYTLQIYRFAYVDDDSTRQLDFENLVAPPATTLDPINPVFVEYTFKTGSGDSTDIIAPTVLQSNPGNGENNVDPVLPPSGYIELVFTDNNSPMINPHTVVGETGTSAGTVKLECITDATLIDLRIDMDTTDLNFKRYLAYPQDPLLNSKQYRLTISIGGSIEDMRGNVVQEVVYTFNTAP